jgi:hypothetical protein
MASKLTSRRMALAFMLSLAASPGVAQAARAIEGDWVGEDGKGRTVRLTIAHGEILQFDASGVSDPKDAPNARRLIRSVRFWRDGRGVAFAFAGGRATAHLDGEVLRVVIRDSLGQTAFTLGRI